MFFDLDSETPLTQPQHSHTICLLVRMTLALVTLLVRALEALLTNGLSGSSWLLISKPNARAAIASIVNAPKYLRLSGIYYSVIFQRFSECHYSHLQHL